MKLGKITAKLGRYFKPGFKILAGTSLVYIAIRICLPESAAFATVFYFLTTTMSIAVLWGGVIRWVQDSQQEAATSNDTRNRFCAELLKMVSKPVNEELSDFKEQAGRAKLRPLPMAAHGCWAFDIPMAKSLEIELRGFLLITGEEIALAIVGGRRGQWHQDHFVRGRATFEGSLITIHAPRGDLLSWARDGSRFILNFDNRDLPTFSFTAGGTACLERSGTPSILANSDLA